MSLVVCIKRGVRARRMIGVASLFCIGAAPAAHAAVLYRLTNLSTLAGVGSYAAAMNASGQVTGQDSASHAFLYSAGVMTDLGTLGGTDGSTGQAINARGVVTGRSYVTGNTTADAYVYINGSMTDLGLFGGAFSSGDAINDSGQISVDVRTTVNSGDHIVLYNNTTAINVGGLGGSQGTIEQSMNASGQLTGWAYTNFNVAEHAFLYSNASLIDLGTFGGNNSFGSAINTTGQIAGYAEVTGNNAYHAFLYSNGSMTDLGTLGGKTSYGESINDAGQVAGYSNVPGNAYHAFLESKGSMIDLGTLGGTSSFGNAINSSGQVVGESQISGNTAYYATVYSNGLMINLNNVITPGSGLTLTEAQGINDAGDIYGVAQDAGGNNYAFELTPVPEPSLGMFTILGLGLLTRRRRN